MIFSRKKIFVTTLCDNEERELNILRSKSQDQARLLSHGAILDQWLDNGACHFSTIKVK